MNSGTLHYEKVAVMSSFFSRALGNAANKWVLFRAAEHPDFSRFEVAGASG